MGHHSCHVQLISGCDISCIVADLLASNLLRRPRICMRNMQEQDPQSIMEKAPTNTSRSRARFAVMRFLDKTVRPCLANRAAHNCSRTGHTYPKHDRKVSSRRCLESIKLPTILSQCRLRNKVKRLGKLLRMSNMLCKHGRLQVDTLTSIGVVAAPGSHLVNSAIEKGACRLSCMVVVQLWPVSLVALPGFWHVLPMAQQPSSNFCDKSW
jgi:hypothetical protein